MIICGIPENSICWANEHRWKNPFKCFTRKTFGGIFEEEFISCWGILFRRFREIQRIANSLSGFLEKKKSKCGVMPTRIASCMQVIFGSIAKTFCSIHENSQTVLFFWKVTRPYSFVNNKLSSSARKQMLLLCFFQYNFSLKTLNKTRKVRQVNYGFLKGERRSCFTLVLKTKENYSC